MWLGQLASLANRARVGADRVRGEELPKEGETPWPVKAARARTNWPGCWWLRRRSARPVARGGGSHANTAGLRCAAAAALAFCRPPFLRELAWAFAVYPTAASPPPPLLLAPGGLPSPSPAVRSSRSSCRSCPLFSGIASTAATEHSSRASPALLKGRMAKTQGGWERNG